MVRPALRRIALPLALALGMLPPHGGAVLAADVTLIPGPPPGTVSTIDGAQLWVDVEHGDYGPYPQQMVLLKVRGQYRIPVTLERLEQPDLPGFRAVQVGRDYWSEATDRGRPARAYERILAVFPQKSGRLDVPAFTHKVTTVGPDGRWVEVPIYSQPFSIDVLPAPADGWWLPAHDVSIEESWSVEPDGMAIGQSTRRIVTIKAGGVLSDQLPPQPDIKAPGLIIFPTQPERSTVIGVKHREMTREQRRQSLKRPGRFEEVPGRDGPIATATYTWAIQPANADPTTLPPLEFHWFDTDAGEIRTVVLPARRVAWVDTGPTLEEMEAALGIAAAPPPAGSGIVNLAAGFAAFLAAGLATSLALSAGRLASGGPGDRLSARIAAAVAAQRLRRAARAGDRTNAWRHFQRLRDMDAAAGRAPLPASAVAALEAAVFGRDEAAGALEAAVRGLLAARRRPLRVPAGHTPSTA